MHQCGKNFLKILSAMSEEGKSLFFNNFQAG